MSPKEWDALSETKKIVWFEEAVSRTGELEDSALPFDLSQLPLSAQGDPMPHTMPQSVAEDVDLITNDPYIRHQTMSSELGNIYAHWKLGKCTVTVAEPDLAKEVLSKEWDRILEGES